MSIVSGSVKKARSQLTFAGNTEKAINVKAKFKKLTVHAKAKVFIVSTRRYHSRKNGVYIQIPDNQCIAVNTQPKIPKFSLHEVQGLYSRQFKKIYPFRYSLNNIPRKSDFKSY